MPVMARKTTELTAMGERRFVSPFSPRIGERV
jgi:hypothetical protein